MMQLAKVLISVARIQKRSVSSMYILPGHMEGQVPTMDVTPPESSSSSWLVTAPIELGLQESPELGGNLGPLPVLETESVSWRFCVRS